jgi:hypothetical protein
MSRLAVVLVVIVVSGLLATSASAIPVDSDHARSVAAERYAESYGSFDPNQAALPASSPSTASSPSDDGGPGWTLTIVAGVVLVVAAAGGGALVGRARMGAGHRLA